MEQQRMKKKVIPMKYYYADFMNLIIIEIEL